MRNSSGFSLIEFLVATAVMLMVTAGVLSLIGPARGAFSTQLEVAELQQRLRASAITLFNDLVIAGAGADLGIRTGPLNRHFAPVLPFRRGAVNDAGPGQFESDTITLSYVPPTPAETTLAADLAPGGTVLEIAVDSNCPQHVSPCGFAAGMDVLVFDDTGSFALFTVTAVNTSPVALTVVRPPHTETTTYSAGSTVIQAVDRTYFLKSDATHNAYQLMSYDGSTNADVPVVDHVVALRFEYYGDPQPPAFPRPPALGVQSTAYAAGENCVWRVDFDSGQQVARLPLLGDGAITTVRLGAAEFTDGPWCPDETSPTRWDADLLRIRKIAVAIRVEAAIDALRGPAGALFARPGTSRSGHGRVPDQEIRFQVAPRNMNLDR